MITEPYHQIYFFLAVRYWSFVCRYADERTLILVSLLSVWFT